MALELEEGGPRSQSPDVSDPVKDLIERWFRPDEGAYDDPLLRELTTDSVDAVHLASQSSSSIGVGSTTGDRQGIYDSELLNSSVEEEGRRTGVPNGSVAPRFRHLGDLPPPPDPQTWTPPVQPRGGIFPTAFGRGVAPVSSSSSSSFSTAPGEEWRSSRSSGPRGGGRVQGRGYQNGLRSSRGSATRLTTYSYVEKKTPSNWRQGLDVCDVSVDASEKEEDERSVKTEWKDFFEKATNGYFGESYVDTHCHIDFLFGKEGYFSTWSQFVKQNARTWSAAYESCITDFCEPSLYLEDHPEALWKTVLAENNVYGAFGCHPHFSDKYTSELEGILESRLSHPAVRAAGEMGLDYSYKNNIDHEVQKTAFRRQLRLAKRLRLPIVIHCRDAEADCLEIMKEEVPADYPIHRHCFTLGMEEAELWLEAFGNLKIGLTPLVVKPNRERRRVLEVVERCPLDRLIIETDAPYFLPFFYRDRAFGRLKNGHPGVGITVGLKIAEARGIPVAEVLSKARNNTRQLYGI